jgi:hypothetical protein
MSTIKVDTIQKNGGASEISIDKLGGVTAAGSMLVVAEGGTNTANLQQGLGKCWLRMDGDFAINDSLNITGITDQAVGNYRVAIANDMGSANYAATTGAGGASSNNTLMNCATPGDALGAGTIDLDLQYVHGTANDPEIISLLIHGDLA